MKYVRIIDEQGYFIEDAFVEELTEFTIEQECPQGFYLPKWDGEKWVEGKTQEEIDLIKASIVVEPTIEERVTNTETKVVTIEEVIDVLVGGV